MKKIFTTLFFVMCKAVFGQTSPIPQLLPYSQDFSSLAHSATGYPSGWLGWTVGTSTGTTYNISAAIADRTLIANSSASTSSGNIHNYNGKIGFLNTGSLDLGLVLSLNTVGKKNILVNYDVMTIRNPYDSSSNTRIREISLQYRTDTIGSFTTLSGIEYRNNTTKQNATGITTPQNLMPKSIVLPSGCDNIPRLQIRWISRDVSGVGLRPSFAIDNIKVDTALVFSPVLIHHAEEGVIPENGVLSINLSAATLASSSFNYSISGSAILGVDYTLIASGISPPLSLTSTSGTIYLASSDSSISIDCIPINDTYVEGMETVVFRITKPPVGFALKDSTVLIKMIDDEPSPISMIQGSGLVAQSGTHYVEGIITGRFPFLSPAGFYLQEEDVDTDADSNTSEGIYVISDTTLDIGDKVRILGDTYEGTLAPSYNQACISPQEIILISKGNPMPRARDIKLPLGSKSDLERYEGMLLHFTDTLTVSNNSNLGKYGEITIAQGGLLYQPSQIIDPNDTVSSGVNASGKSNVSLIDSIIKQNDLRSFLLDDGRASAVSILPYVDANNTLRVGSTLDSLWGIMTFAFDEYRLQPVDISKVKIKHQVRPGVPFIGADANIKVASFNVLNYFNGDGLGGGFPTTRGANSLAEFTRQRDKIINAIIELNADVLGLIEIENDGIGSNSAIQNLVNGVNAYLGAETYSIINDGDTMQQFSKDEIRCGIIYKSKILDTVGAAVLGSDTVFNRPPLAQAFKVKSSDSVFVFVINHFKSKSCEESKGVDKDQADGQGCYNDKRRRQAAALVSFINNEVIPKSKTNRILCMGDYNSYYEEDPLDTIRSGGLIVLSDFRSYSYLYQGQIGSLDNAIVTRELLPFITGVEKWNINSTEPSYLDYEDDIDDGGSDLTNFWSFLYSDVSFRCSDHDPVLVGLRLGEKSGVPNLKSKKDLHIYPNPAIDDLTLTSYSGNIFAIEVFNTIGQLIYAYDTPPSTALFNLDLKQYMPGLYLLRVTTVDGTKSTKRFIKL
ncbi:MAG: ExeM/NucH family extracellular endonuclease [Bacteroidota bacterium]